MHSECMAYRSQAGGFRRFKVASVADMVAASGLKRRLKHNRAVASWAALFRPNVAM